MTFPAVRTRSGSARAIRMASDGARTAPVVRRRSKSISAGSKEMASPTASAHHWSSVTMTEAPGNPGWAIAARYPAADESAGDRNNTQPIVTARNVSSTDRSGRQAHQDASPERGVRASKEALVTPQTRRSRRRRARGREARKQDQQVDVDAYTGPRLPPSGR